MSASALRRDAAASSDMYCDSSSRTFLVSISTSSRSTFATLVDSPCSMVTRSSSIDFMRSCPVISAATRPRFSWTRDATRASRRTRGEDPPTPRARTSRRSPPRREDREARESRGRARRRVPREDVRDPPPFVCNLRTSSARRSSCCERTSACPLITFSCSASRAVRSARTFSRRRSSSSSCLRSRSCAASTSRERYALSCERSST